MELLASKIKALREQQGLSVETLAEELGFAKSTVWAYESGKKQVSVSHLAILADYFNVSVDGLLGRVERTFNVNIQNSSILNEYTFLLDDKPLDQAEIAEAASYIQVKRRMGSYGSTSVQ
ncbi:helix-turn-helix transcriptional regulator [Planococcus sp. N028]|uniref:Helix-turn-helix transcriptional regulator n=1 Tax=Planococcus shixiaomingii TaxID=3058393 RepID=A0ABT8N2F7_9BACL|nr:MULTISPECIES: helix-turn-helix transcriptional regulator [unclassified Planococcus (in: firmicutes)]MDN7242071.1 helix-turn-helix transcriptional regulator [Planococcus sp. N028]WKA54346.1 helix-turn-helix transcriptional regulator [Planococcus sp. N022]